MGNDKSFEERMKVCKEWNAHLERLKEHNRPDNDGTKYLECDQYLEEDFVAITPSEYVDMEYDAEEMAKERRELWESDYLEHQKELRECNDDE